MNFQRGLRVGTLVLLVLSGCSKNKTLNVEGAYTPVIVNVSADREPPVRGDVNVLTAQVSNPRGYPIQYHWSAPAGTLTDSTSATVHWTAPPSIGIYPVTVSIVAHDPDNNVDFFKTRTFQLYVDNEFVRWTRTIAVESDVVPPTGGRIYYTEIRNSATGESDVWALDAPMGSPQQITRHFWQATAPTVQSDGSQVAFLGKVHSNDGGASIWQVPSATGGDTTDATGLVRFGSNTNHLIGPPRFARSGSTLAYSSDTTTFNFSRPKLWSRDAANLNVQPVPIMSTTTVSGSPEVVNTYWNPAWTGDSVVVESFSSFGSSFQTRRGFYKFLAVGTPPINPPTNPEPFSVWLSDPAASEPDWSPNGLHIVFAKPSPGRVDRDIWIINAGASDPAAAVRVTYGPADEYHPRFSNDSTVFFMSNRADGYGANGFYNTERRGVNIWSVSRIDRP